jgi:hypothetical protein
MKDQTRHIDLPLQTRLAPIGTVDKEKRTVELVWTTGARVQRYDWFNDEPFFEELSLAPSSVRLDRLNNGAPLLNTHGRYSLEDVIGVVENASVDGKEGRAMVRFSERDDVKPIFNDVAAGIIRNVSVGYKVNKVEKSRDASGVLTVRVVDWEPQELSLVPIGADAGAGVRSTEKDRKYPCEVIDNTPAAPANQRKENMKTPEELAAEKAAAEKREQEERERAAAAAKTAADAAAASERARVSAIRALIKAHGMTREFEDELIGTEDKKGKTLDEARTAVLAKLAEKTEQTQLRSGHQGIETVQDEVAVRRSLMCNALLHRANPGVIKLEDGARQYAGYTLRELMRKCLELRGVKTDGMTFNRMWERTFESGGDLPNIVLDAATKSLRAAYESTPRTFVPWTKKGTAPDFKNINRIQLSGGPSIDLIQPGGEYKRGVVTDGKETYALATYGKILGITRQTIINDDMNAFTRLPALMARAAADMESDTVWGIITTNGTLQQTTFALFGTSHANLTTGAATGTINITQIGIGRAAMRIQKGLESRPINVRPQFLMVPVAKEGDAEQFTSTAYVASSQSSVNPYSPQGRNPLTPIAEPRLDANSTAAWYLAADPNQVDTIEYSYLEGQDGVYMESRMGWDVDGIELKVREDFAAKALDYRGLWKAAGA